MKRRLIGLGWGVGSRLPHWLREATVRLGSMAANRVQLSGLDNWARNATAITGVPPTRRERRELAASWLRNTLMSLSLGSWSDDAVLSRVEMSDADLAALHDSLAHRGAVLALGHSGSWDLAGAWGARQGIKVVSVAERLPAGLFEHFRAAREAMGMTIYPVGEPDLLAKLAAHVRNHEAVCLLADRDVSGQGIKVPWPGTDRCVPVPAGPALLAAMTEADLLVANVHFEGDAIHISLSDPVPVTSATETMTRVVALLGDEARRHPTSWLRLGGFGEPCANS